MKKIFMSLMEKLVALGDVDSALWYSESFSLIKFRMPDGLYEISISKKEPERVSDEL